MDLEPWNMFSTEHAAAEQQVDANNVIDIDDNLDDNEVMKDLINDNDDDAVVQTSTPTQKRAFVEENSVNDEAAENDTSNSNDNASKRLRGSNAAAAAAAHAIEDDNATFNLNAEVSVYRTRYSSGSLIKKPYDLDNSEKKTEEEEQINFDLGIVYICPACGQEFDEHPQWKQHMNMVHSFNTRQGLNFVQIDKLYHECRECRKRIAMHSMENLLKHKFTHLPFRCSKCRVCERQYKYRQDLMLHCRYMHRDEIAAMTKASGRSLTPKTYMSRSNMNNSANSTLNATPTGWRTSSRLEIKKIQGNALDLFESDGIEVKNEPAVEIDDDDDNVDDDDVVDNEQTNNSLLEDSASAESSRQGALMGMDDESLERWILYICPQCGDEFSKQHAWRLHIERIHNFNSHEGLNFREVNNKQHAQCLECSRLVHVNIIRNLQLHKFTHLHYKKWIQCKMCVGGFSSHKDVMRHLSERHGMNSSSSSRLQQILNEDSRETRDDDYNQMEQATPEVDRAVFEQHIDYLCPQCGKDFFEKKDWRTHLVMAHNLADLKVLRFKMISERQLMCLECHKMITKSNGVQNAQQHRFTHMPHKSYIRCRLCTKSYTDRKGLIKHLMSIHHVGAGMSQQLTNQTNAQVAVSNQRNLQMAKAVAAATAATVKHGIKRKPRTEIVRQGEHVFEIQYLNETDDDDDGNDADADDDNVAVELNNGMSKQSNANGNNTNNAPQTRDLNCDDCGSIFQSKSALDLHVRKEHEFLDYHNLRPVNRAVEKVVTEAQAPMEDDSNSNDLLVPTAEEEVKYATEEGSTSIESNFIYLCPACGQELATQQDWRQHINNVHYYNNHHHLNFDQLNKQTYKCRQCGFVLNNFVKLKTLQDHKFRHLPYKLYIKCLLCGTCYNHKPNMLNHLHLRHNIGDARGAVEVQRNTGGGSSSNTATATTQPLHRFTAAANSAAGASLLARLPGNKTLEDTVTFHNAVDLDFITYYCPQCNENFDSHLFWRKHIVDAHNLASKEGLCFRQIDDQHYMCLQCYKRVTVTHSKGAIGQLQSHKFRHLPYRSFKCLICQELFVRKQMFFKHLDRKTNRCKGAGAAAKSKQDIYEPQIQQQQQQQHQQRQQQQPEEDDNEDEALPVPALLLEPQQEMQELQELPQNDFETESTMQHAIFGMFDNGAAETTLPYMFLCPQCRMQLNTMTAWREHIQAEHGLGQRENLRFKRLNKQMSQCLDCGEQVCAKKLRNLQMHRFKHLRFSAFIQCRFCANSYHNVHNVENHVRVNHPDEVVQKQPSYFEENSISDVDTNSMQATANNTGDDSFAENGTVEIDDDDDNDNDNENDDEEETADNDDSELLLLG